MKNLKIGFVISLLFIVLSISYSVLSVDVMPGVDFWGDTIGFNFMAFVRTDLKSLFKTDMSEDWFGSAGLGISGVSIENFSFMSYEFGFESG